jgi:uncharacterized Zn-finger protein
MDDLNFNFRMNHDTSSAILEQYLQHVKRSATPPQSAYLLWLEGFHAKVIAKEITSPKQEPEPEPDTVEFEDFDITLDDDIKQEINNVLPIIEEVVAQRKSRGASTCEYCGKHYSTRYDLKNHIERRHLKIFKFQCDICEKKFFRNYEVTAHKKRVHFTKRRKLRGSNVTSYKYKREKQSCPYCSKFIDKTEMNLHIQRHLNIKPFKCDKCVRAFVRVADLNFHIKNHHEVSKEPYICSYCEKSFNRLTIYKSHVLK